MARVVRRGWTGRLMAVALSATSLAVGAPTPEAVPAVHGLPFTRSYPLEEIGNVAPGAHLNFDSFGRLAVVQEGVYAVLNDTSWVQMAPPVDQHSMGMANVVEGGDGNTYYGGRGSWGTVSLAANSLLHPKSLVPPDAPVWAHESSFDHIVPMPDGVYFAGAGGVAYWSFAAQRTRIFTLPDTAEIFSVGDKVFASAQGQPLTHIDGRTGALKPIPGTDFGGSRVEYACALDAGHSLVYVRDGRLLVFDGQRLSPWIGQTRNGLSGSVTALQHLVDGGTAVAITGKGLYLISPSGELNLALTTTPYHRITRLASREPGVLWVAVEDAIEKVYYGGAYTVFGQRLGLPVSWPLVFRWGDRIVVLTSGQLYRSVPQPRGSPGFFEAMPGPAGGEIWAAAARGTQLLVGNGTGVYAAEPDGRFELVLPMRGVNNLSMVGPDLCFVIGHEETAVLRWKDGRWSEAAPRIASVGNTPVTHTSSRAVWVEFGGNRVARLALEDGRLVWRVFAESSWKDALWVNVGIVGDTVMFSGVPDQRQIFFDDRTGKFRDDPALRRLLAQSPYPITRIQKDETGTLWATHRRGVVTFTPQPGGGYAVDGTTFNLVNDLYPSVWLLPGDDVWLTCGRSLYHVERRARGEPTPMPHPMLVSIADGRTNAELFDARSPAARPLELSFRQNSLRFRFFSGTYAWRHAPVYEFRLNGRDNWETLGAGTPLSFPGLREGGYRLEVRLAGERSGANPPAVVDFEIRPPWFRTWPAYLAYGLAAALLVLTLVRWSNARSRRRNLMLEQLVHDRTHQLESTMEKLNEETRISATLAERNRLAGEIHDSLQQGLSGAILQLDATLRLPAVIGQLRARLDVVRNMISFTRHEVQHAVWDMESSLLENADLGDALRKLTELIGSGAAAVSVEVTGEPVALSSAVKHHLLRAAQEATTNAVRHANAGQIAIRLEYQPDTVGLTITDDGVGFLPHDVLSKSIGHFGLRGMRARAKRIGADLQIHSAPGEGTSIRLTVPVNETQPLPVDASANPA